MKNVTVAINEKILKVLKAAKRTVSQLAGAYINAADNCAKK